MVKGTIVIPKEYIGDIKILCDTRRGTPLEETLIGTLSLDVENKRYILKFRLPLAEIITDFVDIIKSVTHGYGSFEYDLDGYEKSDIQKLVIHIMGDPVDALSFMVHKDRAFTFAKQICRKLKETIPAQLFLVSIQAKVGTKVIAKEEVPYVKKNVTAKCYGGDYSRKKKLLDRYKEGKKKLRQLGKVQVGKDTFLHVLKQ